MANLEDLQQQVSRVRDLETESHSARERAGEGYANLVAEIADEIVSDAAIERLIAAGPDKGLVASVEDAVRDKIRYAYRCAPGAVVA